MKEVLLGWGGSSRASVVPHEHGTFTGTDSVVAPRAVPFGPHPNKNYMPHFAEGFKPPIYFASQITHGLRVGNLKNQCGNCCNVRIIQLQGTKGITYRGLIQRMNNVTSKAADK